MSGILPISQTDRQILRDLAAKTLEYANLPVMKERKRLWQAHNELRGDRPPVIMEMETFGGDMITSLQCEGEAARQIEWQLQYYIVNHELIDDDKVVPPYFPIYWQIPNKRLDIDLPVTRAADSRGSCIGYRIQHPIADLKADLHLLRPSRYSVDREGTMAWKSFVEDAIGDILPVKLKNNSLFWYFSLTGFAVHLAGMEQLFIAMLDYPAEFHQMMSFVRDDSLGFLAWLEQENLLALNNENDYVGAGSYGFTTELPKSDTGKVTAGDLWGNLNSQESVGISPSMYGDFIFPYYRDVAECFGLVYYGCCEPVHEVWDAHLSKLPNLRKVSISAWCDEEFMGDRLRGGRVIYSRKPSPNFIGVGDRLDEEAFAEHIRRTLTAARGCNLEFIFRDIYTLGGDISKPGRAVKMVRSLIDHMWR